MILKKLYKYSKILTSSNKVLSRLYSTSSGKPWRFESSRRYTQKGDKMLKGILSSFLLYIHDFGNKVNMDLTRSLIL